ncbi:MAG: transcriptional regulator [marine bacterium B5-7]|nr:MAG: transcriptional regulator [marine bacterium B5-7]
MKFKELLNDDSMLAEIGVRVARRRIDLGLTQAVLSEQAGIGKRTLERLEAGESIQLANFLQVLRVLRLVEGLDALLPEPGPRPMELLRQQGKQRKRASTRQSELREQDQPWTWGDES